MFCVICFEDCDFLFRRRNKEIYNKWADAEIETERVQRDKNGNMNNVAFYAVSFSSPYAKFKTQKSPVSNICILNTMSHIGFRSCVYYTVIILQ